MSGEISAIVPVNFGGATPTTVKSIALILTVLPRSIGALVPDDGDRNARRGTLFLEREGAAGGQRHAERVEVVRRHDLDERLPRRVAVGHADHREGMRRQRVEHVVAVADVDVVGVGEAAVRGLRLGAVVAVEADQLIGLAGQRADQQGVDQREHRAVGADPERQHEDRRRP